MKTPTLLLLVLLLIICGCAHTPAPVANHYYRTVSFPNIKMAAGERIESVEVVISCARFTAIRHIPNDWTVGVTSPVSEVSTLEANAGHGSSSLGNSRDLDDFITIRICDPSSFDIKGTAVVVVGDLERTVAFTRKDFVLKP